MFKAQLRFLSSHRATFRELPSLEIVKEKFEFLKAGSSVSEALQLKKSGTVILNGWIDKKPKKVGKNLTFASLRDYNGSKIQLVDSESFLKSSNVEDVVQVEGEIIKKKPKGTPEMEEYEIKVFKLKTLNRANKKPSQLLDFKKDGNYPPEYRYLQLRLPKYQSFLKRRNELSKLVRANLDSLNFTEIETPVLFKSTPEGAREFLVPTRNSQNSTPLFYALPQSPQQYKQLLMAGGVHRYFQIARCFRDEDLRSDRQPEFTQVDLEMAFASGNEVMHVVEKTVSSVWNSLADERRLHTLSSSGEIVPVSNSQPILKMTYKQAMTRYGIDKPDLRFPDLKILDLSEFKAYNKTNSDFPVFEVLILRNAFSNKEDFEENWNFLLNENEYAFRSPIVVPIENEVMESTWFEQFLPIAAFENPKLLTRFLNLRKGDIICGSTRQHSQSQFENPTPLGRLRQIVIQSAKGKKMFQKSENPVATWVVDFPLFSPIETEKKATEGKQQYPVYKHGEFCSTHHPFTMVQLRDYEKLKSNPSSCIGQHYDLVVNGVELGGGSTRIHDPELQNYIFHEILKINNPERLFGHLLTAFEMGTPPHAGFAIGFDRMCAMLCETSSIRDVIAFPKTITGADLVVRSPSVVPRESLEEYHIDYFGKHDGDKDKN